MSAIKSDLLVKDLKKIISDIDITSLDDLIETGHVLDIISKLASKKLDQIKIRLREEALVRNHHQPGNVDLRPGVCLVSIPEPRINIKKGHDMAGVKDLLGPDFQVLFSETNTFKVQEGFEEALKNLNDDRKANVMEAVEMTASSPQVFFKGEN